MKQVHTFIVLFSLIGITNAQWEKHPIVPSDFQDTEAPLWHDLNNDGLDDLLGYDDDISTFFWRRNDGTKLLNPVAINDGNKPLYNSIFTTGDWNNDGHIDIVAQLSTSNSFTIDALLLLNNGDGTFIESEFSFISEQFFGEISHFGDFNNDGIGDIIIEHSFDYYVYINTNGTLQSINYNLNTSSILSTQIYTIDIDGDGLIEILEIDKEFEIQIHEWNADTFQITQSIPAPYPGNPTYSINDRIEFKDLDFDGDLDIVRSIQDLEIVIVGDVGNVIPKSRYLYQHIQGENGIFITESTYISQATGEFFAYTILANKLNEKCSLIIFDADNYTEFSFSNGDFEFDFSTQHAIPETSIGILSSQCLFSTAEENITTLNTNTFTINVGFRSLIPEEIWQWENCLNCNDLSNFEDVAPADIDNDGDLDFIIVDPNNKYQVAIIKNHLSGCDFDSIIPILGQFFNTTTLQVETADLDDDNDLDIIIKSGIDEAEIYTLTNEGNDNFSNPTLLTTIPHGMDLYVEDLYNDGFAEIIIHTGMFSFTSQDPNTFTTTILNNINGIDNHIRDLIMNPTVGGQIEFEDMDEDGDKDMILYNDDPFNESISIFNNDGSSLNETQFHNDFLDMYGMDVFDIDKDGFPDILAFHDGISNNNISTLYQYTNIESKVEFSNPIFLFENIDRYQHLGIHNPDNSIGFVSKTGFANKGVLVYYDEGGVLDTLDHLNPENYFLADLNNDGFEDIVAADEKGGFNFYTQGDINCNTPCLPDTEGFLFFENCGSQEYFLIETLDGVILDPYFDQGVNFNISDGQYVNFSFTDFDIETPCENVRTVLIRCIEEVIHVPLLEDYDWVQDIIDNASGCCEIEKIEALFDINNRYIYISPRSDCPQFAERLYNEDGELLCMEPEDFIGECIDAFGLDMLENTILYQCNPVANQNTFDESLIEIFPNPSHQIFNINTEFQGKLKLYNAQGKYLYKYNNIPFSINLENLDQGLYFLSFENEKFQLTKKIIKL